MLTYTVLFLKLEQTLVNFEKMTPEGTPTYHSTLLFRDIKATLPSVLTVLPIVHHVAIRGTAVHKMRTLLTFKCLVISTSTMRVEGDFFLCAIFEEQDKILLFDLCGVCLGLWVG